MTTKENYESHEWCLKQLDAMKKAESDMRDQARECHAFIDKKDGQWEPYWWNVNDRRPRYTFDQCSSVLSKITAQIRRTDFDVSVRPQNGEATKEVALKYDGIVRNIETVSNAPRKYRSEGKRMTTGGIGGWEVVQKYVDGDSFDQDLAVQTITDYTNRCWLGPHYEQDGSDAKYGWIITGMEVEEYKAKYPERNEMGDSPSDRSGNAYWHRKDQAWVGEFRYLLPRERELALMSNGEVYEVNEDFERIQDELLTEYQVTVVRTRKRTVMEMFTRKFDSAGWIDDEPKETVFRHRLNIIPVYANFKVDDDGKLVYYGAVLKMMDPQRVLNYVKSREVEEVSLAPRKKIHVTPKMVEGHERKLAKLNTSSDPLLVLNPDPQMPNGPREIGGATVNPGLNVLGSDMKDQVREGAGMHHANMADNPNAQSGVAIANLLESGDDGNTEYIESLEIAISATGRVLVDAIPRVYTPGRQVRILDPDGSYEMETIGEVVIDNETGQPVALYDLEAGTYDVYCTSGPSFKSRQSSTLNVFEKLGPLVPGLVESSADIILNNAPGPGMDQAAERVRWQLLLSGAIPEDQQTDEEKQKLAELNQANSAESSPEMALAMAEQGKAEADLINAQTKQMDAQATYAQKADELELKRMELLIKAQEVGAKVEGIEARALRDVVEANSTRIKTALDVGSALQPQQESYQ